MMHDPRTGTYSAVVSRAALQNIVNPPAVSQGGDGIRVETYNIGGLNDDIGPEKKLEYLAKLKSDLKSLVAGGALQVLFLQEVGEQYRGVVSKILNGFHYHVFGGAHLAMAFRNDWWGPEVELLHVFPEPADRHNPHRQWRVFLSVRMHAPEALGGKLWHCASVHTKSGSKKVVGHRGNTIENHEIPGSNASEKERFKAAALSGVVRACRKRSPPDASQGGFIIAGDVNITNKNIRKALQNDPNGVGAFNCVGQDPDKERYLGYFKTGNIESQTEADKDWVLSDQSVQSIRSLPAGGHPGPRLAWDKAHVSLAAVIALGVTSDPAASQGGSFESTSPRMEVCADAKVATVREDLKEQAEQRHQATSERERKRECAESRRELLEETREPGGAPLVLGPSLASSSSGARDLSVEDQRLLSHAKRPRLLDPPLVP